MACRLTRPRGNYGMSRREVQREVNNQTEIGQALHWVRAMIERGLPGGPVLVSLGRPRRTKDQNAKLWPMLQDVAEQVPWSVIDHNGEEVRAYLTPDDWKNIFTATLRKHTTVPGIDGGFVVLGMSTSGMSKSQFSELIELIYSFGAECGVEWSKPASKAITEHRKAA